MCRILLIDDNPEDRLLILRELNREFPNLQAEEIIKAEGLSHALNAGNFDLVITDYQLRWNDGLTVLQEIKSRYPDCPVIMFTDSGNQEVAVEAMKAGLDDYIVKSPKHFVRLSLAVRSALQRAESQQQAKRLEMRLQALLNRLNVGVFRSTLDGCLLEGNAAFLRLLGVSSFQEAQTLDLQELWRQPEVGLQQNLGIPPRRPPNLGGTGFTPPKVGELAGQNDGVCVSPVQGLNWEREVQLRRADGSTIWVYLSQTFSRTEVEPVIEGLMEDISDRKLAQEALQRAKDELEIRVTERTQSLRQTNEQLRQEMQERQQAQENLRESEERYRQVVEVCPDAIFIQCGGKFVFLNSATVKLYGATSPEELIGRSVLELVHPDYREIVEERIRLIREGKPAQLREIKLVKLDGTVIDVEVAAVPFTYQEMPAAQVVVRDISDRKLAEKELRKALEKERELSQLKSRIITTISHEYRTPLTVILSSAELLENYEDQFSKEKKLTHLQRIQTSTRHLANLVNDVLFVGQAELGRLEFNPAPLDLEQFCQMLVEELGTGIQNQTILTSNMRGNCTNACLDEKLLRQILTNLLSNAIKYSPHGGTVRFDLECAGSLACFCIQDSGIGIPEEDLPQLFESFHRASNVGTIPGTGLGLAIVKKCVDLHGGQISVNSRVGVGTTFTVTLPLNYPVIPIH